jgi:hypothetical protein
MRIKPVIPFSCTPCALLCYIVQQRPLLPLSSIPPPGDPASRFIPSIPFNSRLLLPNCFFGEPMRSRHQALADSSPRPIGLRHVGTSQKRQPINGEYRDHIICDRTADGLFSSLPTMPLTKRSSTCWLYGTKESRGGCEIT